MNLGIGIILGAFPSLLSRTFTCSAASSVVAMAKYTALL